MEEDEKTAKRREQFKAERIKLAEAMEIINNLENSSGDASARPVHVSLDSDSEMGEGVL